MPAPTGTSTRTTTTTRVTSMWRTCRPPPRRSSWSAGPPAPGPPHPRRQRASSSRRSIYPGTARRSPSRSHDNTLDPANDSDTLLGFFYSGDVFVRDLDTDTTELVEPQHTRRTATGASYGAFDRHRRQPRQLRHPVLEPRPRRHRRGPGRLRAQTGPAARSPSPAVPTARAGAKVRHDTCPR